VDDDANLAIAVDEQGSDVGTVWYKERPLGS
jgi:hypothetical protein